MSDSEPMIGDVSDEVDEAEILDRMIRAGLPKRLAQRARKAAPLLEEAGRLQAQIDAYGRSGSVPPPDLVQKLDQVGERLKALLAEEHHEFTPEWAWPELIKLGSLWSEEEDQYALLPAGVLRDC